MPKLSAARHATIRPHTAVISSGVMFSFRIVLLDEKAWLADFECRARDGISGLELMLDG